MIKWITQKDIETLEADAFKDPHSGICFQASDMSPEDISFIRSLFECSDHRSFSLRPRRGNTIMTKSDFFFLCVDVTLLIISLYHESYGWAALWASLIIITLGRWWIFYRD